MLRLHTVVRPHLPLMTRPFSATTCAYKGDFISKPGPPQLPPKEQREFEELVRKNTVVLDMNDEEQVMAEIEAVSAEALDRTRRTITEFEGEVNPVTGEVGGPKQEPLRHGDWSFGGRVTDF